MVLTRQQLLSVLYSGLRDKSKVRVKKKVAKVQTEEFGVSVLTEDGESYHGDLVVGADGVHSVVRPELWRMATQERQAFPLRDRSG